MNTIRIALGGDNVTALRTGSAKYAIPVRLTLPPERETSLEALLKLQVRSQDGALIPLIGAGAVVATRRERTIYHKDLLPVVYVVGDMAGKLDSPLYGMFAMRSRLTGESSAAGGTLKEYFIRQPPTRYAQYAFKWDGEWQVTYETFRDMGIAYAVGLVLIYLLVVAQFKSYLTPLVIMAPIPLTVIGVMPGHAAARRAVHRDLDDRHDRACRHHRQELDPARRFRQSTGRGGHRFPGSDHPIRRDPCEADRAHRASRRCSARCSSWTTRSSAVSRWR